MEHRPPLCDRKDLYLLGATFSMLSEGNVPFRQSPWHLPTWRSRPLVRTKARCVSRMQLSWTDYLVVSGADQYQTVIDSFIAETYRDRSNTGIEFRFLMNDTLLNRVQIYNTSVTLNKDPEDTWPLDQRKMRMTLTDTDVLRLQVRNVTFQDQFVFGGVFGYYYEAVDASEAGTEPYSEGEPR